MHVYINSILYKYIQIYSYCRSRLYPFYDHIYIYIYICIYTYIYIYIYIYIHLFPHIEFIYFILNIIIIMMISYCRALLDPFYGRPIL
jgi:hypothetical protein